MQLGRYDAAAQRLQQALARWDEAAQQIAVEQTTAAQLPVEHAQGAAATLFQLGHLRRLQGRYAEASELLQRATAFCSGACQSGPAAALGPALWGDLYLDQGRLAAAEAAYGQARDRDPRGVGEVQADVWNGLAVVYRRQGRYGEAEYAARKSVAVARQGLGERHVKVAVGLANLGLIQAFERKYSAARKSLDAALAAMERNVGSDNPGVAAILRNLALVERKTGHAAAAEPLLRRALAIYQAAPGSEQRAVASTLASLGLAALDRGDPWAAEERFRKALTLTETSLGVEHPETAALLVHLGLALTATGRAEQALDLYERAVAIQKRTLGKEHPEVVATMAIWAKGLRAAGYKGDAARLEKQARRMHSQQARDSFTGQTVDVETLLRGSADQR